MRTCPSPSDDGYKAVYIEEVIYPQGTVYVKHSRRHAEVMGNEPEDSIHEMMISCNVETPRKSKH